MEIPKEELKRSRFDIEHLQSIPTYPPPFSFSLKTGEHLNVTTVLASSVKPSPDSRAFSISSKVIATRVPDL
jgi:hypothetical protein